MRLYDNSRTVANEDAILADFQQRSRHVYATYPYHTEVYGTHIRQHMDVFLCEEEQAPVLVFIHGNNWQLGSKEDFAFIVPLLLQQGLDVILLEYPLLPEVSFAQLVHSIGQSLDFLSEQILWQNRQVYLCGHGAGAHLSAYWQSHSWVNHIIAISGLYALSPLAATRLNDVLQLNDHDIATYSPIIQNASHKPLHIAYGLQELEEMQWQSTHYAEQLIHQNSYPVLHPMVNINHYTILDHIFTTQNGMLAKLLDTE